MVVTLGRTLAIGSRVECYTPSVVHWQQAALGSVLDFPGRILAKGWAGSNDGRPRSYSVCMLCLDEC